MEAGTRRGGGRNKEGWRQEQGGMEAGTRRDGGRNKEGWRQEQGGLFVNDGILNPSREALRTQFETQKAELVKMGLKLNPEKCASLVLLPNKKKKYTVVDTHLCLR